MPTYLVYMALSIYMVSSLSRARVCIVHPRCVKALARLPVCLPCLFLFIGGWTPGGERDGWFAM